MTIDIYPEIVCLNCGGRIQHEGELPQYLHAALGNIHQGICCDCDQHFIILVDVAGAYITHYTAAPYEIYGWPCALKIGKHTHQIVKEDRDTARRREELYQREKYQRRLFD